MAAFDRADFEVVSTLLNASWFGVAQNRPRLIIVGFNRELYPGLKWQPPEIETEEPIPVKALLRSCRHRVLDARPGPEFNQAASQSLVYDAEIKEL